MIWMVTNNRKNESAIAAGLSFCDKVLEQKYNDPCKSYRINKKRQKLYRRNSVFQFAVTLYEMDYLFKIIIYHITGNRAEGF